MEVWEGETVDKKCDSHQRDVKGIREVCQLTERCDGVKKYDSPKEVCQLVGRCDGHGEK